MHGAAAARCAGRFGKLHDVLHARYASGFTARGLCEHLLSFKFVVVVGDDARMGERLVQTFLDCVSSVQMRAVCGSTFRIRAG